MRRRLRRSSQAKPGRPGGVRIPLVNMVLAIGASNRPILEQIREPRSFAWYLGNKFHRGFSCLKRVVWPGDAAEARRLGVYRGNVQWIHCHRDRGLDAKSSSWRSAVGFGEVKGVANWGCLGLEKMEAIRSVPRSRTSWSTAGLHCEMTAKIAGR
ncbi:hypothetical protein LIA77_03336 [Sarocladium implicatum]|nr:hypothetical protein LIA77_03336 [Sarocladium implicatum]